MSMALKVLQRVNQSSVIPAKKIRPRYQYRIYILFFFFFSQTNCLEFTYWVKWFENKGWVIFAVMLKKRKYLDFFKTFIVAYLSCVENFTSQKLLRLKKVTFPFGSCKYVILLFISENYLLYILNWQKGQFLRRLFWRIRPWDSFIILKVPTLDW